MSFENKGFPNDLNSRYEALNKNYEYYTPPFNVPLGNPKMISYGVPTNVPTPKSLQAIGGSAIKNVANPDTLAGSTIGTETNPTELPEFTVTAKKKKSPMTYILAGLILLLAIYFIYRYTTKKS